MAEEQKPVEVAAPVAVEETAAPVVVEETPAVVEPVPVVEDKPAEEAKPAETEEPAEAAKEEDKKEEEAKPIEEGFLGHKAQGASFPKNLIASKAFFFFGSDAVEAEVLAAYKKAEKHVEVAQHNIAWATHTGKGLLFIGDKKAPHGVINLADATEPENDGSNKFHFSAKGNKHSFKANSAAERDNWVAQLKEKIAEAKELATTVTESEIYKQTIESFKPAPKEEKVEAPKEEAAPAEEAAAPAAEPAAAEETVAKEETKDELKAEEPSKRRSASRKRASFFGFGKKEEKKEEAKPEEAATETPAVVEPVPETEAPATEEVVPAVEPAVEAEAKTSDEAAQPESPKEKPAVNKRTSFFGNVFSKKEKKAADVKPEAESPKEEEEVPATTEAAPVIPPVEATTPLAVDVSSPATVPTETTEAAVTNGDAKKEKEKRKSSLPFTFGKRDKSPGPASEGEEKKGAFSKLRATIKGKGAAKPEDKPAEEAKEEDAIKEEEETPAAEAAKEEAKEEEAPKPEEPEAENKPEGAPAAAPVVTAAA
ncbi:pleckstrin homology domain-containing protein [Trichoderma breve]|uniref:Pleckstrin homology domain-containing protein n=1 Tax=Trichoderma breve TaxID=2034170 RepID=A0A9W9BK99_9HYPO|nr:pleckstrin homology domain-containing protein [Trichoderma breve]KAJ4862884.1 pleckstrin homology domain-containing protein [Trichoderma breve]